MTIGNISEPYTCRLSCGTCFPCGHDNPWGIPAVAAQDGTHAAVTPAVAPSWEKSKRRKVPGPAPAVLLVSCVAAVHVGRCAQGNSTGAMMAYTVHPDGTIKADGKTPIAIANAMGIKPSSVSSTLRRARPLLAKL